MRFEVLAEAWREASLPSEREHVVPFIMNRPEQFTLREVHCPDGDYGDERWTVDEPEDLQLIQAVYGALYTNDPTFGWQSVLKWLQMHPEIHDLNRQHDREAGYKKSLVEDERVQQ
jgi:spore coat polysaccharide biosynthesis protein SpsF